MTPVLLDLDGVDGLVAVLLGRGFTVLGPTVEDEVIDHRPIGSAADLPVGWGDDQRPGRYRSMPVATGPAWVFGFATTAQSPKRWFHPPAEQVLVARRGDDGRITFSPTDGELPTEEPPLAFIGVRGCDLAALAKLDRVLTGGDHVDGPYARRRRASVLVAVECSHPADSCFCTSMGTGPGVVPGAGAAADIVLTELPPKGDGHRFLATSGTDVGAELLAAIDRHPASEADVEGAGAVTAAAAAAIRRRLPTEGLREALLAQPDHPAWADTADRCLACGNCTMACPTCFCTSTRESTDLSGHTATRTREWESCFALSFTEVHGGVARESVTSRYRHWATHKLSTWFDQFDESGCVGCGRCLTWCPVAIDLTALGAAVLVPAAVVAGATGATGSDVAADATPEGHR